MPTSLACIAGEEIHRQWAAGRIAGENIGPRRTPFGDSGEVFTVTEADTTYYLMCRYGPAGVKTAPAKVNTRANIYALKDLGVQRLGLCHCTSLPAITRLAAVLGDRFCFNTTGTVLTVPEEC